MGGGCRGGGGGGGRGSLKPLWSNKLGTCAQQNLSKY